MEDGHVAFKAPAKGISKQLLPVTLHKEGLDKTRDFGTQDLLRQGLRMNEFNHLKALVLTTKAWPKHFIVSLEEKMSIENQQFY